MPPPRPGSPRPSGEVHHGPAATSTTSRDAYLAEMAERILTDVEEAVELALRGAAALVVFVLGWVAARARWSSRGDGGGPRDIGLD